MKTPRKWLLFAENSPKGGGWKIFKVEGGANPKGGGSIF